MIFSGPSYSHERIPQNNYVIDFSHINRYQQERRLRELTSAFEQSPPSYASSVNQTRRQQLPLFTPIRTTPYVHKTSPVYLTKPPSYAEIFLTDQ